MMLANGGQGYRICTKRKTSYGLAFGILCWFGMRTTQWRASSRSPRASGPTPQNCQVVLSRQNAGPCPVRALLHWCWRYAYQPAKRVLLTRSGLGTVSRVIVARINSGYNTRLGPHLCTRGKTKRKTNERIYIFEMSQSKGHIARWYWWVKF